MTWTSVVVIFNCYTPQVRNSFLKLLKQFVEETLPDSGCFPFDECVLEMGNYWIEGEEG